MKMVHYSILNFKIKSVMISKMDNCFCDKDNHLKFKKCWRYEYEARV